MKQKYDIIFKSGTLVDPVNRTTGQADIGITDGKITEISPDLDPVLAQECTDIKGLHILPGIIDLHVHASSWLGGKYSHKMMAEAGVTTALDVSGPVESVLDIARDYGTGLNLACIQYVRPGHTVKNADPSRAELNELLHSSLKKGALGLKILGGHYPLTPEATALAIEVARTNNTYLTFHAGSLNTKSDIKGFHEAVELTGGRSLTLAHINSYCRGRVKPYIKETEEAIEALEKHPHICSESYLSPYNGTSAKCSNGVPESQVTVMCLTAGGFPVTQKGLEDAIYAGWAHINMESGGRVVLATGKKGVKWWQHRQTDTTVSFPVNPAIPRLRLATAKRSDKSFVVDCIITDGGGIPRNVTVELGLSLVKLAALTIEEFVMKTSRNPACILGLKNKGHLAVGADADITVVNVKHQIPVLSLSNGKIVMVRGRVCGKGTKFITTLEGVDFVKANDLEPLVLDPTETQFHMRPIGPVYTI